MNKKTQINVEVVSGNENFKLDTISNSTYQISHDQYLHFLLEATKCNGFYCKIKIIKKDEFNFEEYPFYDDCFEEDLIEEYNSLKGQCNEDEMVTMTNEYLTKEEIILLLRKKMENYEIQNQSHDDTYYLDEQFQKLQLLLNIIEN